MLKDVDPSTRAFETLLHECDESGSIGFDNLPTFILHQCSSQLASAVQEQFVRIIQSKTWPLCSKTSYIISLHKSGSIYNIFNYRPISVTPKISFIPERLIFHHVYCIISRVIKRQQFGLMKRRGTVTHLISYFEND